MTYPRYWRDIVENNITHICEEFGSKLKLRCTCGPHGRCHWPHPTCLWTTPKTEEDARNLYHLWLNKLALGGEDL